MAKIEIETLRSVNGIPFGSNKTEVRKTFGASFKEHPKKIKETEESKKSYDQIVERMAKMAGQTVEEFVKDVPPVNSRIYDEYLFGMINYSRNQIFESIEIPSDQKTQLIVDGKDCSDFSIAKLKTLADDFVWDSLNTSWMSQSKQIGIYCPENDKTVECVLFGCPGYYEE